MYFEKKLDELLKRRKELEADIKVLSEELQAVTLAIWSLQRAGWSWSEKEGTKDV